MVRTNTFPGLGLRYRKPVVKTTLKQLSGPGQIGGPPKTAILPPVFYHGTCAFQVLRWQKEGGIGGYGFSSSSSLLDAAVYANYELTKDSDKSWLKLRNSAGRDIHIPMQHIQMIGLQGELKKLKRNGVTQTLIFLDRDSLLELDDADFVKYFEVERPFGAAKEYDNLYIRKEGGKLIPLNGMFAALDLAANGKARFRIFDQALWDLNFDGPPPSSKDLGASDRMSMLIGRFYR
jgi:hypothetical protein